MRVRTYSLMTTANTEMYYCEAILIFILKRRGGEKIKKKRAQSFHESSNPQTRPWCSLGVKMQFLPHRDVPGKLLRLLNNFIHTQKVFKKGKEKKWKKKYL